MTVFPISEGAYKCFADNDPTRILWRAHEKEVRRRRAELWNYGKHTEDNYILSKTNIGYLESQIDPATMKVAHCWSEF
jgi:hypothetical protein